MSDDATPADSVRCEGVTFGYGSTPVLAAFSHTFAPGIALLQGYSGCGKSTLLKLIAGYLSPTQGCITLPGGHSPHDLAFQRRSLGFVFQQLNLLPLASLERNLEIVGTVAGLDAREIRSRTDALLSPLGLAPYRKRRPAELSGGQQQRAAIARALIRRPRVLLLDEPTSGLDDQNTQVIARILSEHLPAHCCCIIATHDARLKPLTHAILDFNRFLPAEGHLEPLG